MKIAITLIHNKTDKQNAQQIDDLAALLRTVEDGPFTNPDTGETWTTFHQELIGLPFPHEVKVYQILPFGVTPPPNRYLINSGGTVQYGAGDEDKTGNHPRFFNWGLKRGTDYGAEASVYLENVKELDIEALAASLNTLADPTDKHEFVEDAAMKVASLDLPPLFGPSIMRVRRPAAAPPLP